MGESVTRGTSESGKGRQNDPREINFEQGEHTWTQTSCVQNITSSCMAMPCWWVQTSLKQLSMTGWNGFTHAWCVGHTWLVFVVKVDFHKQSMHALLSHFGHRPQLVLLPASFRQGKCPFQSQSLNRSKTRFSGRHKSDVRVVQNGSLQSNKNHRALLWRYLRWFLVW